MKIKNLLLALPLIFLTSNSLAQSPLSDVQSYDYERSVSFLAENEIIGGYPDGTYKPNKAINRAEFSKIIMRAIFEDSAFEGLDGDCFGDVTAGNWFTPYVCLAKEEGVIQGYNDGSFRPEQNINQAEALKIIYEAFFEPVEVVGDLWYEKYLAAAEYDGMLYFSPDSPGEHVVTRGEMAYFLAWILDETGDASDQISYESFYGEGFELAFGFELTPEDCYEDEYYDKQDKTCYLLDTSDYLADSENEAGYFDDDFDYSEGHSPESAEESVLAEYSINGDTIELNSKNEVDDAEAHQKIWNKFTTLIPLSHRNHFAKYLVFEDEVSGTLAYVEPLSDDLNTWVIGVNLTDLFNEDGSYTNEGDLNHTLIHEYAHVLSLNPTQIDPSLEEENCYPRYFIQEGCSKTNAFINLFFKAFWTRDMLMTVESDEEDGPIELYDSRPSSFVTDYAATNPVEDMAESFTAFVLNPKPKSCELDQKSEKVCSFYKHETLLNLRKRIRMSLTN